MAVKASPEVIRDMEKELLKTAQDSGNDQQRNTDGVKKISTVG